MSIQEVVCSDEPRADSKGNIRFAAFVPKTMFRNLEVYCLANNIRKNQVVLEALSDYLRARGMEPDSTPQVKYSYESQ